MINAANARGLQHFFVCACKAALWCDIMSPASVSTAHLKPWESSLLSELGIVAVHLSMPSVGVCNRRCGSRACCFLNRSSNRIPRSGEVGWVVCGHHLNDLGSEWQHPVAFADSPVEQDLTNLQGNSKGRLYYWTTVGVVHWWKDLLRHQEQQPR